MAENLKSYFGVREHVSQKLKKEEWLDSCFILF
jgi:hypothetical protein